MPTPVPPSGSWTRGRTCFRNVARLGMEAAEALEHAHAEGIVHHDIKPANLMFNARGHLRITDSGLARLQTDSGLTTTGDLLGTLRYNRPGQSMGQRAYLDHRTDIHSLGVAPGTSSRPWSRPPAAVIAWGCCDGSPRTSPGPRGDSTARSRVNWRRSSSRRWPRSR